MITAIFVGLAFAGEMMAVNKPTDSEYQVVGLFLIVFIVMDLIEFARNLYRE